MRILITGASGFLGKNLISRLQSQNDEHIIYCFDADNTREELVRFLKDCDFVFNFAAVHRPKDTSEFDKVNHVFFEDLLETLIACGNHPPVLYTSSIQATNGTEYGNSKLAAEAALREYQKKTGARAIIYRLTNTFGRWATPNHHSVVATFCYNLVNGLPLSISDRNFVMNFYYIDDVIDSFISSLNGKTAQEFGEITTLPKEKIYSITLGNLADKLTAIAESKVSGHPYICVDPIDEKLVITYESYFRESAYATT